MGPCGGYGALEHMSKIVVIDFTGTVVENGAVFETTREADAKAGNVFDGHARYQPIPIVLGKGQFLPKIEEGIEKLDEGKSMDVTLEPKDAFGEYSAEKIGLVAAAEFKKHNVNPTVGLVVDVNGQAGRVQSVSGGRVRVDFNHELAGKKVRYQVTVNKVLTKPEDQAKALVDRYIPMKGDRIKTELKNNEVFVSMPPIPAKEMYDLKHHLSHQLMDNVDGVKKVHFTETFEEHKHEHAH